MNPYKSIVSEYVALKAKGRALPLGQMEPLPAKVVGPEAPRALIFSPHPDDECIIGGWALRLMREAHYRVINVAVTQGSAKSRQQERWQELEAACKHLGFGLERIGLQGLEQINTKCRESNAGLWEKSVTTIAKILEREKPSVIFFPHVRDWNSTHIGTYWLLHDALVTLPSSFSTLLVYTEFWGAMDHPNVMVEISATDLADLMAALSFHVGEVKRNPYHLTLPAWMQDNVRRGGELVGGQGGSVPDFTFATLYRLERWKNGRTEPVLEGGSFVSASANAADLLQPAQKR